MRTANQQSGFTLVELALVMVGMIAISIPLTSVIESKQDQLLVEGTAREIVSIQEAAIHYYTQAGAWPDSVATLVAQNYLPSGATTSPWGNSYLITSTANNFSVSTITDSNANATRFRSRLPFPTIVNNNVTSSITVPGRESAHTALIPRDGSRAWTGNQDAGGQNLSNANVITAVRSTATSDMRASVYIDRDNTTYRFNGDGATRTNLIDTNTMRLLTVKSIGASCNSGTLARLSNGELLNCVSGRYKQTSGTARVSYYRGVASCGGVCTATIPNKHHLCTTGTIESNGDTEGGGGYVFRRGSADNRGRWTWRYRIYKGDESANQYVVSCLTVG